MPVVPMMSEINIPRYFCFCLSKLSRVNVQQHNESWNICLKLYVNLLIFDVSKWDPLEAVARKVNWHPSVCFCSGSPSLEDQVLENSNYTFNITISCSFLMSNRFCIFDPTLLWPTPANKLYHQLVKICCQIQHAAAYFWRCLVMEKSPGSIN